MKKWWLSPVVILLALLIVAGLFWETISIYIAPKAVLTAALTDTVQALEHRYGSGPLPILLNGLDPAGKNTVDLRLIKESPLVGTVTYDMRLQTEQNPRRILAEGTANVQGKSLDLNLYLDSQFAALSSAEVLQGKYYGLTYESFADDVANSMVLRLLVDQKTLSQWKESVASLEEIMNQPFSLPDVSQIDPDKLILGVLALDAEVEREVLVLDGEQLPCFVISMETSGAQILQGMDLIGAALPVSIASDDEIGISFWMHQGVIRKAELELEAVSEEKKVTVLMGEDPKTDDIQILIQDSLGYQEFTISTATVESACRETIAIRKVQRNLPSELHIQYQWNPTDGEVDLSVTRNGQQVDTSFALKKLDNGFLLETQDVESLMHLLLGTKDTGDSACSLAVTRGAEFATPEYKNFSQWSLEDMLLLATGLGGLFGVQIP